MVKFLEFNMASSEFILDVVGLFSNIFAWALIVASPFIPLHLYIYESVVFMQWQKEDVLIYQLCFYVLGSLSTGGLIYWFSKGVIGRYRLRTSVYGLLFVFFLYIKFIFSITVY